MHYIYAVTASLGLVGVLVYYHLTKNYGYWKKTCVPYLTGTIPGFGNVFPMLCMRQNFSDMYLEFYNKMPSCSMMGFYNLREPALLVRDPELVKSVLQTNFSSFSLNGIDVNPNLDRLLSRNPFILHGEKWKAARQQISSAFTSGKLKFMYGSIGEVCEKLVTYLNDKISEGHGETEVESKNLFSRYTAEVVASAAYGVEGNSFKDDGNDTFVKIGKIMFEPSISNGLRQIAVMFVPMMGHIFRISLLPQEIDKVFMRLVKDMVKYREEQNVQRNDFLQLMMNLKKTGALDHSYHGGDFRDETIAAHSASFFFDGYETSSVVLSFVCYQLAVNPKVQQRLRDEVSSAIKKHNGLTYEALSEMTYMEQVFHESMRIYPPVGALFKVCTKEIELKGSDGITFRVTPGAQVVIPVGGLQRDPKYWSDPEKFDPDRFSVENKENNHSFTFLPFGTGSRVCIGVRMAMLQIKAAIATTIKNYSLELSPKTQLPIKLDPRYFMASVVGGLWVKVKPV